MKRYIPLFALLGLVGCFLPIIGGTSITIFDLRHHSAWLTMLAFVVPMFAWRTKWGAAASLACFVFMAMRARTLALILYAGIGGKLIGVAIVGGAIAAFGALLEERAVAS